MANPRPTSTVGNRLIAGAFLAAVMVPACSGNSNALREVDAGLGGESASGGATQGGTRSGGTSSQVGGSAGSSGSNIGGTTNPAGGNATSGQLVGGAGGATATGGVSGNAGQSSTAGAGGIVAGGSAAIGGASSGGTSAVGGATEGGTVTGGSVATGGVNTTAAAVGGQNAGGTSATGGVNAGGTAAAAGTNTGGANTGGTSTGSTCTDACSLGDKRCETGGMQSCVTGSSGCSEWGQATLCEGTRSCSGVAPNASCVCPTPPTGCENGAGSYCSDPQTLETCSVGTDGCTIKGSPTGCPTGKPCLGSFPGATCSCQPPPTICSNTTGTFCESPTSVVTCSRNSEHCLVISSSGPCPSSKPCGGPAGAAACTCQSVPACDTQPNGSYCSGTNIISCTADIDGCQVANNNPCPTGKPCGGSFPNAACTCPAAPGICLSSGSFTPGQACDTNGHLRTCGPDGNSCPALTSDATCPSPQTCQGSLPSAACVCPAAPACNSYASGKHCSDATTLITCADVNSCQQPTTSSCVVVANEKCVGSFPNSKCELAFGYATDLGTQSSLDPAFLYGESIQVTTAIALTRLGLIAAADVGSNVHVRMAIYASDGGNPGNWLASATGTPNLVAAGRNEFAITSPPTPPTIDAGTYWIFAVFDSAAKLGRGSGSVSVRYNANWTPWNSPFPTALTGLATGTLGPADYYVVGVP